MLADITQVRWPHAKKRRDELRARRWCINGPMGPPGTRGRRGLVVHGEVVKGGKCERCLETWSKSK